MDEYVHLIYKLTKEFPKEELFGSTSQLRRSSLSVVLNYIEGYARGNNKIHRNFLNISYGSLKESKYLLRFSLVEKYMVEKDYQESIKLADEISAMLWSTIKKIDTE